MYKTSPSLKPYLNFFMNIKLIQIYFQVFKFGFQNNINMFVHLAAPSPNTAFGWQCAFDLNKSIRITALLEKKKLLDSLLLHQLMLSSISTTLQRYSHTRKCNWDILGNFTQYDVTSIKSLENVNWFSHHVNKIFPSPYIEIKSHLIQEK